MPWFFSLLKYLGGAYLLFLGVMLLRTPVQSFDNRGSDSFLQVENVKRQFLIGFISAILNPKNAIFYLSLFTVMVADQTGFVTRCFYALWMTTVVFVWDVLVAIIIGQGRIKAWFSRCVFLVEKISGVMLMFFGIFLPFV